jgi:hypothetical protein
MLPSGPETATFLTEEERTTAVNRLLVDSAGTAEMGRTSWKHVMQALSSPHVLGCAIGFYFTKSGPLFTWLCTVKLDVYVNIYIVPLHNLLPFSVPRSLREWGTPAPLPNSYQLAHTLVQPKLLLRCLKLNACPLERLSPALYLLSLVGYPTSAGKEP